jgi:hypothetical protein
LPRASRELVNLGVDLVVTVTSQGLVEAKPALATFPSSWPQAIIRLNAGSSRA